MRIVPLSDIWDELQGHLRRKELFPIIGSGFTRGSQTKFEKIVPSGSDMIVHMKEYIKSHGHPGDLPHNDFAHVARYYEKVVDPHDFWQYFRDYFLGVKLSDAKKKFLDAGWRFIYTLNLDDAIENNSDYKTKVTPGHTPRWEALNDSKCVLKLHGDAQEIVNYKDSDQVLTIVEYVTSLERNRPLLDKLKEDLDYSNTIFIGCSLSDEFDLLSVSQQLNSKSGSKKNRYFVTKDEPNAFQKMDLEEFGIDTIILVSDYDNFYRDFAELAKAASCVQLDQLEEFHNIPSGQAPTDKSIDYLLRGKFLLDKHKHVIYYPSFFIQRDLSTQLLGEMETYRIQIVHGGRISGKSYLLAGLLKQISNRDTYYFDSRNLIDVSLLESILKRHRSVLLFDTNVLTRRAIKYLLELDLRILEQADINVICCVNNSDREVFSLISYVRQYSRLPVKHIKTYELEKQLSTYKGGEVDRLNSKLKNNKITPFIRKLSILDNLLEIRKDMPKKSSFKNLQFDPPPVITTEDSGKLALLILLVQNGKVLPQQLTQCRLNQESADLTRELKLTVEEDHRNQLQLSTGDSASYQLVSNATFWLLSQLHIISQDSSLRNTIIEAFHLLVQSFLAGTRHYKNVENLVKFDKLNEIFPDGKGLIIDIYDELRPMLMESYQYFHQFSKCRLWGLNKPGYEKSELDQARIDAITAYKMATEAHEHAPDAISHRVALAHILFTLTVIHTKSCIEENFEDPDTLNATFDFFFKATTYVENYEAMRGTKNNNPDDEENSIISEWISLMLMGKGKVPASQQRNWTRILSYWKSL